MLFALDIDGTIGRDTNHIARILTREFSLPLSEKALDQVGSLSAFLRLRAVRAYLDNCSEEQREAFREALRAAGRHPDVQRNRIPMPGAVGALQELAREGANVIYTTCRQPESEQLTRDWLARHGFPYPDRAYCCQHYHHKYLKAHELAESEEPVIVIDDQVENMVNGFRALAHSHAEVARQLYRRLAVVAFACKRIPTFPVKIPFLVVTLKSWRPKDLASLRRTWLTLEHAVQKRTETTLFRI
jgi:uncharacterized HAD superfamily protein